jgi:RimJ/RimL family protein N-acetyltransferase
LLQHLQSLATRRVFIGTWADATWAIRFYEKHGYRLVPAEQKDQLLRRYWNVSARQIETSVVLSNREVGPNAYDHSS